MTLDEAIVELGKLTEDRDSVMTRSKRPYDLETRVWLLEQRLTCGVMGFSPEIIDNEVCCPFCKKSLVDMRKVGCSPPNKHSFCWFGPK